MNPLPFTIHSNTCIGFGKLKGLPHSTLLLPEHLEYSRWILSQGEEFRYNDTRQWILDQNLPVQEEKTGYFKMNKYISIVAKNDANGNEHPYYVSFTNELLTLTRKYKDFITLKL
jgi:hypothetical protein